MSKASSERILVTPSSYTKSQYLYIQEIGTLKSLEPHISRREKLDSYLFFLVLDGCGTITFQDVSYPVQAGDCVWLNCVEPYSHESSGHSPWSLMWVHFNGHQAKGFYQLYKEREGPVVYTPPTLSAYIELMKTLFGLQQQKEAFSDLLSHRYLTDLIAQIFSDAFYPSSFAPVPQKLLDVRKYIEQHHTEKLTLDTLSERFFISKYHLLREYQRLFGSTIINDLNAKRLSHAKSLLRFSDESVESIALACGFQNSSYFIKVFKRYENLTPLAYRKKW